MFRFLKSCRKGQFFIIAAVIIVSILFSIYGIYLGYYAVDSSIVQDFDSTYLLNDIKKETERIYEFNENESCEIIDNVLDDYKLFVQRSVLESGSVVKYDYTNTRGCILTHFDIDIRSRDSRVNKEFTLNTPHTLSHWDLHDTSSFNTFVANPDGNITIESGGYLNLTNDRVMGNITYVNNPGRVVIWHNNTRSFDPPTAGSSVRMFWFVNGSGNIGCTDDGEWTSYSPFNSLPVEFQCLKQVISLTRLPNGISPILKSSNTTYATRP